MRNGTPNPASSLKWMRRFIQAFGLGRQFVAASLRNSAKRFGLVLSTCFVSHWQAFCCQTQNTTIVPVARLCLPAGVLQLVILDRSVENFELGVKGVSRVPGNCAATLCGHLVNLNGMVCDQCHDSGIDSLGEVWNVGYEGETLGRERVRVDLSIV